MLQQAFSEKIVQLSERNVKGLQKVGVLDKIFFIQKEKSPVALHAIIVWFTDQIKDDREDDVSMKVVMIIMTTM